MNPMQCRGQVEGGVAQALGTPLCENVRIDEHGAVETVAHRRYRLPRYADVPRTEVHFMETADAIGPLGAKVDEREPLQPGRARLRQRPAGRDGRQLHRTSADPRPDAAGTGRLAPYPPSTRIALIPLMCRAPQRSCGSTSCGPARSSGVSSMLTASRTGA